MPESIEPSYLELRCKEIHDNKELQLTKQLSIKFDPVTQLIFKKDELLPLHTNGMRFTAFDKTENKFTQKIYY